MSKNVNVKEFIAAQRTCNSTQELADYLGKTYAAVNQRITKLREEGFGAYLKPYNETPAKRGRKSLKDQFAELTTWEHDQREMLLENDNEMRMDLAVK